MYTNSMYSTYRRSLNDRPMPRRVQTIKSPTHGTHSHLRSPAFAFVSGCCVCVRASAFSSVRPRLRPRVCSMHFRLRPCMFVCVRACSSVSVPVHVHSCVCVRTSAIVRVHIIKRPDASGKALRLDAFFVQEPSRCTIHTQCTHTVYVHTQCTHTHTHMHTHPCVHTDTELVHESVRGSNAYTQRG